MHPDILCVFSIKIAIHKFGLGVQNNSRARKEIADSIDIDDFEKQRAVRGNDRVTDP